MFLVKVNMDFLVLRKDGRLFKKLNMDFSSRGKMDFSYKRKDVTIRYN